MISWLLLLFYCYFSTLVGQTSAGLSDGSGHPLGDCFINFWSAAKLALTGRVQEIYDWQAFHTFEQSVVHADLMYFHYSYPPVMLLLTLPLAWLPYVPALFVWLVVTWAFFYGALRMAHPTINILFLSLATPAFILNLAAGQNGALTAALLGAGLTILPKRPMLAGILFGLLCFKPQVMFLVPVALIAGKYWHTLAVAFLTILFLGLVSLAFYGVGIWTDYLQLSQVLRHYVLEDNTAHSWQQFISVFVAARQLGVSISMSYLIQGIVALSALYAVVKLWRQSVPHDVRCAALVLGTFMATPYAMDYDLVVTTFVAVWLSRSYRYSEFVIVPLLLAPVVSTFMGQFYGIGVGPFMLLPSFLLTLSSFRLLQPVSAIAEVLTPSNKLLNRSRHFKANDDVPKTN